MPLTTSPPTFFLDLNFLSSTRRAPCPSSCRLHAAVQNLRRRTESEAIWGMALWLSGRVCACTRISAFKRWSKINRRRLALYKSRIIFQLRPTGDVGAGGGSLCRHSARQAKKKVLEGISRTACCVALHFRIG